MLCNARHVCAAKTGGPQAVTLVLLHFQLRLTLEGFPPRCSLASVGLYRSIQRLSGPPPTSTFRSRR